MRILFFDTETTGLVNKNAPILGDLQPDVVQLAAVLADVHGAIVDQMAHIIAPREGGKPIEPKAEQTHGISRKVREQQGQDGRTAAEMFLLLAEKADALVAHNSDFDVIAMARMCAVHSLDPMASNDLKCFADKPVLDTMAAAAPVLNLPPTARMRRAGYNKPKPPTLAEAYRHFTGQKLEGAHDALVDVLACRTVFNGLLNGGHIQIPGTL